MHNATQQPHQFIFRPVQEGDIPLLYSWFKMPHVAQWWPIPENDTEDFFRSFLKRIRFKADPFLVLCDNRPIGYLQTYELNQEAKSWLPPLPQGKTIVGIDQFIGDPAYLHKGFGTLFIKAFIKNMVAKNANLTFLVDPDPSNKAAIRCYEKVGFQKVGECQAPWGPALVMFFTQQ